MVGIAGRMFTSLAQGNINIEMISQGASEVNISCVIEGRDAEKALNLIHQSCLQIKVEERRGRGKQSPTSVPIDNRLIVPMTQLGRGYSNFESRFVIPVLEGIVSRRRVTGYGLLSPRG